MWKAGHRDTLKHSSKVFIFLEGSVTVFRQELSFGNITWKFHHIEYLITLLLYMIFDYITVSRVYLVFRHLSETVPVLSADHERRCSASLLVFISVNSSEIYVSMMF